MRFRRTFALASAAALGLLFAPSPAQAAPPDRYPTAVGYGGAVVRHPVVAG